MEQPAWLAAAWAELGQREVTGAADNARIRIRAFFRDVGQPASLHDEVAWCAAFAGACLERAGHASTRSLMARSYLRWGEALDDGRIGAVAVLSRGGDPAAGHVGFLLGETDAHVMLLGGNQGDAVRWGQALGAAVGQMGAYQGHGSVAVPQEALITWALMMEGGFQVNLRGERFSNEHSGYSEQAVSVLAQPEGLAWDIYDQRLHELGMTFEDYRNAVAQGAVKSAVTAAQLAALLGLPADALSATIEDCEAYATGEAEDRFGRDFTSSAPLAPPFFGVKVTGALFHTQGGLAVDGQARVRRADGGTLANLFAAGGAAGGVSGPAVWGYLSGNGLLSAVTLGRIAGAAAARLSPGDAA